MTPAPLLQVDEVDGETVFACAECLEMTDERDLKDADGDSLCPRCLKRWAKERAAERLGSDLAEMVEIVTSSRPARGGGRCLCGEQMIGPGQRAAKVDGRWHVLNGLCDAPF